MTYCTTLPRCDITEHLFLYNFVTVEKVVSKCTRSSSVQAREHMNTVGYHKATVRVVDDIEVFSISDIVGENLWSRSPESVASFADEWCKEHDIPYGKGEVSEVVSDPLVRARGKVLHAEM